MSKTITVLEAKDLEAMEDGTEVWVLLGFTNGTINPFLKWTKRADREGQPWHQPRGTNTDLYLSNGDLASFMPVMRVDAELLGIA